MWRKLERLAYKMYRRTAINYRPKWNRFWYHAWKALYLYRYEREATDGEVSSTNE